jgi:hypothetical protein
VMLALFGRELAWTRVVRHTQVAFDYGNGQVELRRNLIHARASLSEQPRLGGERKFRLVRYPQNTLRRRGIRIQMPILSK